VLFFAMFFRNFSQSFFIALPCTDGLQHLHYNSCVNPLCLMGGKNVLKQA
jgi:hypothetical protein